MGVNECMCGCVCVILLFYTIIIRFEGEYVCYSIVFDLYGRWLVNGNSGWVWKEEKWGKGGEEESVRSRLSRREEEERVGEVVGKVWIDRGGLILKIRWGGGVEVVGSRLNEMIEDGEGGYWRWESRVVL